MSASHKGVRLSPEHRAALSVAHTGRRQTAETRAKIGALKIGNKYWVGRKHKPETLAKMRAAKLGNRNGATPCSDDTRARISAALTGVPLTPEHRAALSRSHLLHISNGYAYAKFLGSWVFTHRLAWTFYHGPIPEGQVICPTNGDRLDCDEENLEAMTIGDHVRFHKLSRIEELAA